jgi:hypothetical protein
MGVPDSATGLLISILVYVTSLIGAVWTWAWKLGALKADQDTKRMEAEARLRSEMDNANDQLSKRVGESLAAIRQKMTDMELWNRDNLVRRGDLQSIISLAERNALQASATVAAKLEHIDQKMDKMESRSTELEVNIGAIKAMLARPNQ